jgi:SAM-dependent methyltransferase
MTTFANVNVTGVSQRIEGLDAEQLRSAIREEYSRVAADPEHGFHFHTGHRLARILDYPEAWLARLPHEAVASFAGTGNPLSAGEPAPGERVVDVGCGAGIDSLIAASMVGESGAVFGVDMTPAMVERARTAAASAGLSNVTFRQGYAEELPVASSWADLVISNGVLNLFPDKLAGLGEMARVLRPGGRLQIGDILVQKSVGEKAKRDINLWKG